MCHQPTSEIDSRSTDWELHPTDRPLYCSNNLVLVLTFHFQQYYSGYMEATYSLACYEQRNINSVYKNRQKQSVKERDNSSVQFCYLLVLLSVISVIFVMSAGLFCGISCYLSVDSICFFFTYLTRDAPFIFSQ